MIDRLPIIGSYLADRRRDDNWHREFGRGLTGTSGLEVDPMLLAEDPTEKFNRLRVDEETGVLLD